MLARILVFIAVAAVLVSLLVYSQRRAVPEKASGFIEAHDIRVGSRVGGRIAKVLVVEGLILGSLVAGISWMAHLTHATPRTPLTKTNPATSAKPTTIAGVR